MAATVFISDLHLRAEQPAAIDCLLRFLAQQQGHARALYILGDLFDSWIGDDHPEDAYRPVKMALRQCADAGTPVFALHGNRDFLLGDRFTAEAGCTLIDDPTRLVIDSIETLLLHGDSLCTDDRDYQQLRARLRQPEWQRQALALPAEERLQLAQQARELSALANADKDEYIMDVNQDEVRRAFDRHAVRLMIHGHTHRPAIHRFEHRGQTCTRVVLGDWYAQGSALFIEDGQFELKTLPL